MWGESLETTLSVIGLNHRTAPVEVRELFWLDEETRREELERFRADFGLLGPPEEQALEALTVQLVHRISTQLARELKRTPERPEQELLTAAVRRLFGLQSKVAAAKKTSYNPSGAALAGNN